MLPTIQEAERLLQEADERNPGPWSGHSRVAAQCARKIAALCADMNPDKAYVVGLLHDIGRRFGPSHLAHVIDGYDYLMGLGYDEAARICVTHSFAIKDIGTYIGSADVTAEQYQLIQSLVRDYPYDDYDRLIQLCDSIALPERATDLATRMDDVEKRYGYYPQNKREEHFRIKAYFDQKAGMDLYEAVIDPATQSTKKISADNDQFSIRPAAPQDSPRLTDLACASESQWGFSEAFMEAFRVQYAVTEAYIMDHIVMVLENTRSHTPIGFYGLKINSKNPELEYFYIAPEHMGKGCGRLLWLHLKETCSIQSVHNFTFVTSPQALPFYKKMGANVVSEISSGIDGRPIPLLRYEL